MTSTQMAIEEPIVTVWDILRIVKRRFWLIALLMIVSVSTALFLSMRSPKRWRATAQMILIQRAPNASMAQNGPYTTPVVETPETQVAMLQSTGMSRRTINWLKNQAMSSSAQSEAIHITPEELQRSISVTCPKDTNVLSVDVDAGSRADAETLANAVCQAFVTWKRDVAQQSTQDTTDTLEVRARRAREQMVDAEKREVQFKQRHGLVDVPTQHKAALEQFLARDTEVASLGEELASQKARFEGISEQLGASNAAIRSGTGVRDDSLVVQLQAQLNQLEMDRQAASLKYTKDYPGVLPDLDARIDDVKKRLAQAIKGTLDNQKPSLQAQGALVDEFKQAQIATSFAQAKYDAASKQRDVLRSQLKGVPALGILYARLSRNARHVPPTLRIFAGRSQLRAASIRTWRAATCRYRSSRRCPNAR